MTSNTAAWMVEKYAPLQVREAPYTPPRAHEMVVEVHAVAFNPVDWLIPYVGDFAFPWIKYPFVPGTDISGEVVELGPGVSRFRLGDRVLAHAVGMEKSRNTPAEGAFQTHVVVLDHMAAPIPDSLAYEQAAVLPLGLSTAACGLFQQDYLALQSPSLEPRPAGKTLIVWGGSTSVGCNAIQLARAAGYEVVTTASPKNFDYVRSLGASQAFDYASPTVVPEIVAALKGKTIAGAIAIGTTSARGCVDIVRACQGNRFVATASFPLPVDRLPTRSGLSPKLLRMIVDLGAFNAAMALRCLMGGVRTKFISGASLMDNEVSRLIYQDFLPRALAEGRYIAAPPPLIVGHGLESVQLGFETQKKGMSARKVVITL
jgi:NADPH:quinone reductase-like Zn-dependent oxidoreductase